MLGYIALILAHELGHASLVKAFRFNVEGIVLHGLGGECSYSGPVTQQKRSIIAWGGVAAQTAVLAATLVIGLVIPPEGWSELYTTLTRTNALLIAINLIPIPGFDGYHAWKLVFGSRKRPAPAKRVHTPPNRAADDVSANVLRFPSERVSRTTTGDPGEALRDVNAQILEITEKVNRESSKKKRPTGEP